MSSSILAIDFGTSACSVAVQAQGGPSVVCDERGAPRMPSVVAVTQKKRLVGQAA